ncbi:hypothetical protein [Bdellovibrio sp. BCCA]|uniref:hypothetical protein n=1 Tax=Bdellovibrio sp. BCCA TaxID=3136281 RepID=UPI0025D4D6CA|nr:hypothetical protein [uncultured Bdellovibrio sp.]
MKNVLRTMVAAVVATSFAACGGGGGGGGGTPGGGGTTLYYPYETVYGDACKTQEATPGCTFFASNGKRITVTEDPHYNDYGHGSDDLWYVKFDASGKAAVYDDLGRFQYYANVSEFAGYVGGTTIGVGTTGFYWEDISNGTYWLGKNGVLYNANTGESNYGQAINEKNASSASDTNFAALNSDTNKKLVKMASEKLMKEYGFKQDKAVAVASALNSWAVAAAERGTTSEKDMDKTFKAVFGVQFSDALAAAKDLAMGDSSSMQDLTNRSASELGLKPHQAQKFMKGMYKKALANWGYDENSFNW